MVMNIWCSSIIDAAVNSRRKRLCMNLFTYLKIIFLVLRNMNITVKTSSYNYKGITDGIYIRIMSFMQKMVFQEVDPFFDR